jgi:DNA-binding beta-propeller fold protein YncE
LSPDGKWLAILNDLPINAVQILSTANKHIVATYAVEAFPIDLAWTPDSGTVFVACSSANSVTKIIIATGVVSNIPVDSGPSGVTVSHSGAFALVACFTAKTIVKINIATNATTSTPTGLALLRNIVISPDDSLAFFIANASSQIIRFVISTSTVVPQTASASAVTGSAMTSDGVTLWIATKTSLRPYTVLTSVFGTEIALGTTSTYGAFITADGAFVITMNVSGQNIKILTVATSVVSTASVGAGANSLALTPDSKTAYIANSGGFTVSKVTLASLVTQNIFSGHAPFWVTYANHWIYSSNYFDNTIRAIAA